MADEKSGRWVDLGEAGRRLGVAPDALRKRIRRGSCPWPARRDNRGRWEVMVPDAAADVRADTGGRREDARTDAELLARAAVAEALVAELREQVATVKAELHREMTEGRAERDRLLALVEQMAARRPLWTEVKAWVVRRLRGESGA